jgi:hypothetical protein
MTLLDAKQYDPTGDRRRRNIIATVVVAVLVLISLGWLYRNWPEEHVVDQFFAALQNTDFEKAYGVWMHDPNWKQHPDKYSQYPFNDFYRDWGPGGEWGIIKSYKVYGSVTPRGGGSGVILELTINDRAEHARLWVQKSDKTVTFSPF